MIVANEPYLQEVPVHARIDFVSLYFCILWYSSILRGSVDQKHTKQTKFEDKTVKSTQLSLVPVGLHDFQIFPGRTAHAWSVEAGKICSVSVFFVWVGSQISPRRVKKDSNIPSFGRTRSVECPTPGPTKTIKSLPHALPPPYRRDIDRCIKMTYDFKPWSRDLLFSVKQKVFSRKRPLLKNLLLSSGNGGPCGSKCIWYNYFKIIAT